MRHDLEDGENRYALGPVEVEQLAKVVDETSNLHPLWLSISADGLGSLQSVLDLRKRGLLTELGSI